MRWILGIPQLGPSPLLPPPFLLEPSPAPAPATPAGACGGAASPPLLGAEVSETVAQRVGFSCTLRLMPEKWPPFSSTAFICPATQFTHCLGSVNRESSQPRRQLTLRTT